MQASGCYLLLRHLAARSWPILTRQPFSQVVGYMGVPYYNTDMTRHPQYITVRNDRGQDMLAAVKDRLEITPTMSEGSRQSFVMQTVVADDV